MKSEKLMAPLLLDYLRYLKILNLLSIVTPDLIQ